MEKCEVHKYHSPRPQRVIIHHVVPKAWGGIVAAANQVRVCDTGHYNIHALIDEYVRAGEKPPWPIRRSFDVNERKLAERAWEGRPNDHPPLTAPAQPAP